MMHSGFIVGLIVLFIIISIVLRFVYSYSRGVNRFIERNTVTQLAGGASGSTRQAARLKADYPKSSLAWSTWTDVDGLSSAERLDRTKAFYDHFPGDVTSVVAYARALAKVERFAEAEKILIRARSRWRPIEKQYWLYHEMAVFAEVRRDWPLVVSRWREVQTKFPARVSGFVGEAKVVLRAGKLEEADCLIAKALLVAPQDQECLRQFAEIAEIQKDWAAAVGRWREYHRSCPWEAMPQLRLARALCENNNFSAAKDTLGQIALLFSTHQDVNAQRLELEAYLAGAMADADARGSATKAVGGA